MLKKMMIVGCLLCSYGSYAKNHQKQLSQFLPQSQQVMEEQSFGPWAQAQGLKNFSMMVYKEKRDPGYWVFEKKHLSNGEYLKRKSFYEWYLKHQKSLEALLTNPFISPAENFSQFPKNLSLDFMNWIFFKQGESKHCMDRFGLGPSDREGLFNVFYHIGLVSLNHVLWTFSGPSHQYLNDLSVRMKEYFKQAQLYQQKRLNQKKGIFKAS
jgi:hypothetical protein